MVGYKIDDQVAIVTGASRGIGRAIALKLAEEGVQVVVNYSSEADKQFGNPFEKVITEIRGKGGNAVAYDMDIADLGKHQGLLDFTLSNYGRVDALVNNAGIVPFVDFLNVTPKIFDQTHAVNARGPYFLTQLVVKYLIENKIRGNIIFISSVTSSMFGGSTLSHYAGTKASLLAYTRSLAGSLAPYGIRVNAVLPGTHKTDVNAKDLEQPGCIPGLTKGQEMDRRIPLGLGKPEDIGGLVAFLLSEDARYITGAHLVVDGGWTTTLQ